MLMGLISPAALCRRPLHSCLELLHLYFRYLSSFSCSIIAAYDHCTNLRNCFICTFDTSVPLAAPSLLHTTTAQPFGTASPVLPVHPGSGLEIKIQTISLAVLTVMCHISEIRIRILQVKNNLSVFYAAFHI